MRRSIAPPARPRSAARPPPPPAPPRATAAAAGGSRHAADQRPDQPVAAEAAVEVARGRTSTQRAHRMPAIASSSCSRPAGPGQGGIAIRRPRDPRRIDRLGPKADPVAGPAARPAPAPGCRRRGGGGSRPRRGRAGSGPSCRAASGTARAAGASAFSDRAGEHRPGTSGWRRRSGGRGGGRETARRARLRRGAGDGAHGGDRGGSGQNPAGGGERGGLHLGPQDRQRRALGGLVSGRQRPDGSGGLGGAGVFLGHDLARLRAAHSPRRL